MPIWLARLFKKSPIRPIPGPEVHISSELACKMAHFLRNTHPEELSCEDVHNLLDQFAEATLSGAQRSSLLDQVQRHLALCADCKEELEAVLRVLQAAAPDGSG